jgi:hypothetical protein
VADIGGSFSFRDHQALHPGGVSPAGTAGEPLPCLNSDNCTESSSSLQLSAYGRKRAFAVVMDLDRLMQSGPIEEVVVIAMTFLGRPSPRQAAKKFHSFWTHELGKEFPEWMRILEPHKKGGVHYHLAARTAGVDIRSGFNFALYERVNQINSRQDIAESEKKLLRRQVRAELGVLTTNAELKRIHRMLNVKDKNGRTVKDRYGIGRTEIVPIKTTVEQAAKYMGKYLTKEMVLSFDGRKNRIVSYSRGFRRAATTRFSWHTPGGQIWRRKVEKFAINQGCINLDDLKEKFGPRWAYQNREMILNQPGTFEYNTGREAGCVMVPEVAVNSLPVPPKGSRQAVKGRDEPVNIDDPDWSVESGVQLLEPVGSGDQLLC